MGRTSHAREKLLAVAFDLIHESSYGSVSVEQICHRARVNKGSFYYFFKTKTDLVVAAYEEHWRLKEPNYERMFSRRNPPLKRLQSWCDYIRKTQRQRQRKYRHVCGCPYTSVGGELATQDKKVRLETQALIGRFVEYLAGAIADAIKDGSALGGRSGDQSHAGSCLCGRAFAARQNLQRPQNTEASRNGTVCLDRRGNSQGPFVMRRFPTRQQARLQ